MDKQASYLGIAKQVRLSVDECLCVPNKRFWGDLKETVANRFLCANSRSSSFSNQNHPNLNYSKNKNDIINCTCIVIF